MLHPAACNYIYVEFDNVELAAITYFKARPSSKGVRNTSSQPNGLVGTPAPHVETRDGSEDFSINVREFFSLFLAITLWGPDLTQSNRMVHLKAWIDNSAAVSWSNKLASPNKLAQQLLRVMGLTLAKYRIHVSSDHIPGDWNYMADHGSRISLSNTSAAIWHSFSNSWSRTQVPPALRHAYRCDSSHTNKPHWPHPHDGPTPAPGHDGSSGAKPRASTRGYVPTNHNTPAGYSVMPLTFTNVPTNPTEHPPSCPKSALLLGIIRPPTISPSVSRPDTKSSSKAWPGPDSPTNGPNQPPPLCYSPTTGPTIPQLDETTPFGAALSSPSFSACEQASTPVLPQKQTITCGNKTSPSTTNVAISPIPSRTHSPSTYSSGAARPTRRPEVAPDHSLDLATTLYARSSLRGACELLATRSELAPRIHSASTRPRTTKRVTFQLPSSPTQSAKRQKVEESTRDISPLTPCAVEERLKCFSEAAPTLQSSSLDDGNLMHTSSISASKPARTNESHLK